MRSKKESLHLLVPGLLGPMQLPEPLQPLPKLEALLSRADRKAIPGSDLESTLFSLFGATPPPDEALPVAAYRRLGDGGERDDRYWLEVSPVYLRPDRDRLLLFDSVDLDFNQDEAESLATLFNGHFSSEGWQLETPDPHRWYLALDSSPAVTTTGMSQVYGRNIDTFLPRGKESMRWHGIMNEVQMLFYDTDLNIERAGRGKLPINGLWFSGGGRLLDGLATPFHTVQSDEPLARGLAVATGAELQTNGDKAVIPGSDGAVLLVYDRLQRPVWRADPFDWSDELFLFEQWLSPLVDALRKKQISEILVYPCNGSCYRLTPRVLRRFWRRRRELSHWLDSAAAK